MVTRRLEAATSRLEDMATSVDASHPDTVAAINSASTVPGKLTAAAAVIEPPPEPVQPLPRSVEGFDKIIKEEVQGFVTASEKIGDLVEQQVEDHPRLTRGKLTLFFTGPGSVTSFRGRTNLTASFHKGQEAEYAACRTLYGDSQIYRHRG